MKYKKYADKIEKIYSECTSQLDQEIFALVENDFTENGYFVEFGATNGVELSNTYLLEKKFRWDGILAEPGKIWHEQLTKNRNCNIDFHCIYKKSGEKITFHESDMAFLSTIKDFAEMDDANKKNRIAGKQYEVETLSLTDLLIKHSAPKVINYLSIDTEGSEYEILLNFDFEKFNVRTITVEHNYMPSRKKIYDLLKAKGFYRVCIEKSRWDDWYTKNKPMTLFV